MPSHTAFYKKVIQLLCNDKMDVNINRLESISVFQRFAGTERK